MSLTTFIKDSYEFKHQYKIKHKQGFGGEHFAYPNTFVNTQIA